MALVLRQQLAIVPEPQRLVNRRNVWDWTPLHILANGGANADARAGMIAQLCQAKADVEVVNQTGRRHSWWLRRQSSMHRPKPA